MQEKEITEKFLLLITDCKTKKPFYDPYIGSDGNTYEFETLIYFIQNKMESPLSKKILTIDIIIPNIKMREVSQNFLKENPDFEKDVYKPNLFLKKLYNSILRKEDLTNILEHYKENSSSIKDNIEILMNAAYKKNNLNIIRLFSLDDTLKESAEQCFKEYAKLPWGKYPNIIYFTIHQPDSFNQLQSVTKFLGEKAPELILSPCLEEYTNSDSDDDDEFTIPLNNAFEAAWYHYFFATGKELLRHLSVDQFRDTLDSLRAFYRIDMRILATVQLLFTDLPQLFHDDARQAIITEMQLEIERYIKPNIKEILHFLWANNELNTTCLSAYTTKEISDQIIISDHLLEFAYQENNAPLFAYLLSLLDISQIKQSLIYEKWYKIIPLVSALFLKESSEFFQLMLNALGKEGLIEGIEYTRGLSAHPDSFSYFKIQNLLLEALIKSKTDRLTMMFNLLGSDIKPYFLEKTENYNGLSILIHYGSLDQLKYVWNILGDEAISAALEGNDFVNSNAIHSAVISKKPNVLTFIIKSLGDYAIPAAKQIGIDNIFDLSMASDNEFAFRTFYNLIGEKDADEMILKMRRPITEKFRQLITQLSPIDEHLLSKNQASKHSFEDSDDEEHNTYKRSRALSFL